MCSVAKTWENVNTDHADVKELIPEFYQPPGDFLVNSMVCMASNPSVHSCMYEDVLEAGFGASK